MHTQYWPRISVFFSLRTKECCGNHSRMWPRISHSSHSAIIEDRVRSTPVVNLISRILLDAKLRYCVRASVFSFNGSMNGPLAMALIKNGEISGDARLLVSKIIQHLAAMETWHFFYFVTDRGDRVLVRVRARTALLSSAQMRLQLLRYS